jgi:hypothetical protein
VPSQPELDVPVRPLLRLLQVRREEIRVTQWELDWLGAFAVVGSGAAGLTAIILFARKVWPGFRKFIAALFKFVTIVDSVAGLPAFIDRTDAGMAAQTKALDDHGAIIQILRHQVQNDHGTNLRDDLTESLENQIAMKATLARLTASDVAQWREIEDTRPNYKTPRVPFAPKEQT